jgi:OOP family OmpA-OmpF porin
MAPAIPISLPVSQRSPDAMFELDEIYFKFDSTDIRVAEGYHIMELLAQALRERPIDRVLIEGHACALGSDAYNMKLSDRRANSIEQWLIDRQNVAPEKLLTVAWGERHPRYSNAQESTRMLNRRVTFKIFYKPRMTNLPQAAARPAH